MANHPIDPKVTVYIANHNYEKYVEQAIESVLKQTMDDWELIVIDDGSRDGSREIIEKYQDHPKTRLVFQNQRGLNVTNNIAFRLARGQYFMRLDADDILAPEALMTLSDVLDRLPTIGLVFPDYYHVDEAGEIIELVRRHDFEIVGLLDQPAHGACTMFRRECLDVIGGYNEAYTCQDGFDIWLRLIEHYEAKNVNLPLFYYRRHGSNLTRDEGRLLDTRAEIFAKRAEAKGGKNPVVGVIPVRGGSIDPRSMELQTLGHKPLIEWTIDAAIGSRSLDRIIVTTPDRAILDHVENRYSDDRLRLHERPAELAGLNTELALSVKDAIARHSDDKQQFSYAITLVIESPFRTPSEIDMAADVLTVFDVDSVVSVRPELDLFYQHHGNGLVPMRRQPGLRLEREEMFREAGQIFGTRAPFLKENNRIVGGRIGHFIVKESSALRLSSDWTWELAGSISEKMQETLEADAVRVS